MLPIQTFETVEFLALCKVLKLLVPTCGRNLIGLKPLDWIGLRRIIGEDFDRRIINGFGDFVGIVNETLRFSIRKRRSIGKYSDDLLAMMLQRGHQLTIKFTSYEENRADFEAAYGKNAKANI